MNVNDPIGDMLTRVRNGQMNFSSYVYSPASKLRERVLDVLLKEGYIRGYTREDKGPQGRLRIELKYYQERPVIEMVKRISKPGCRVYTTVKQMPLVNNGLGISVVSTPKGVMSDVEARNQNLGGEIICNVF